MAAHNANQADGLSYQPQNNRSNDGITNGGGAEANQNAPASNGNTSQRTKNNWTSGTTVLVVIVAMLSAVAFALVVRLDVYVHSELRHVNERMNRLESLYNSGCTMNKTPPNSEVENDDLNFNLSVAFKEVQDNISNLTNMIQTVQITHENDIDEIQMDVSAMLIRINMSLTNSLMLFADKAASNISELTKYVEREISGVRDDLLALAQNISVLTDQVSVLERRLHELERNAVELERSINERLSEVMTNVSSNEEHLRDISLTHVELTTTIQKVERNVSSLEDHFAQQLTDVRENFTGTLLGFNSSLSEIDKNHRLHLRNLSSSLNILSSEVVATKEAFTANITALGDKFTELDKDLAYINEHQMNLSSLQSGLSLELSDFKAMHFDNISSISETLDHLNEELAETNEHIQNLSAIQNGLQHNLSLTHEVLLSNISALEQRFIEAINLTEVELHNLSLQHTELQFNLTAQRHTLEASTSALQERLELVNGNLNLTEAKLQTLTAQHNNLQSDYNATKSDLYITRESVHQVEHNHSLILEQHFTLLGEAALNRSELSRRIDNNSKLVESQRQVTGDIISNVSTIERRLSNISNTLSPKVEHIAERVDQIERHVVNQSETLNLFDNRIHGVEVNLSLLNVAVHPIPFGFLLLGIISVFVCYVISV